MVTRRLLDTSLIALVFGCMFAAPAGAQPAVDGWPGLDTSKLQTMFVTDTSGTVTTGKLLRIDPESLALLVNEQERRLDRERVLRIQKRDSVRNGVLIGAAVGVALGLVAAGISDCPGEPAGHCPGFRATAFVMSTAIYTAMGVGIDLMVPGRTTIYRAP